MTPKRPDSGQSKNFAGPNGSGSSADNAGASIVLCVLFGWLVVALSFRFDLVRSSDLGLISFFGPALRDVSLTLVFAAFWVALLRLSGPSLHWFFLLSFVSFGLLLYSFSVLNATYFLHTGMRMRESLVVYILSRSGDLSEVLATAIDPAFYRRSATVALVFLTSLVCGARIRRFDARLPRYLAAALGVAAILTALIPLPKGATRHGLDRPALLDFLRPSPDLAVLYDGLEVPDDGPYYIAPRLLEVGDRLPDVVLVILESTGAHQVPPWINDPARKKSSPFMAELARQSWMVDTAYVSTTHTSKALVGILCGINPRATIDIYETNMATGWPLRCLPELLEEAGYKTYFLQSAPGSFEQRRVLTRRLGFGAAVFREELEVAGHRPLGYVGMNSMAMLKPAELVLQGDGPNFLTILTSATHHPYVLPGPDGAVHPPSTAEFPAFHAMSLALQDRFLRDLFAIIAGAEKRRDVLLIVVGDHGEAFGEHLRLSHDFVPYEEVTRVPLLLWGPRVLGPPRTIDGLRHHHDLLPTVLDTLGIEWSGVLPGRSLYGPAHDSVLTLCWGTVECAALRRGDRSAAYFFGSRPLEVYDLDTDPKQLRDLAPGLTAEEIRKIESEILLKRRRQDRFWREVDEAGGDE